MPRHIALTLLIVSIAAVLQSDAQDPAPPRRLTPPADATALQPSNASDLDSSDNPQHGSHPITQIPLAVGGDEPPVKAAAGRPPEAIELFHCDFGPDWDTNFDNWPDRWSREHSVDYPHYLPIRIVEEPSPAGSRSLRIDLDGAAGAVHTPHVKVDALYTYVVEGYVRTEGLEHDEACLVLTFLGANNKPVEAHRSDRLARTTDWTKVRIGPVSSVGKDVKGAVVTLRLGPGERADLRGSAWFADIWMGRLPRMTLTADHRSHLYFDDETPRITCAASGFAEQHTKVLFELVDVNGNVVDQSEGRLVPQEELDNSASIKPLPAEPSTSRSQQGLPADSATSRQRGGPGAPLDPSPGQAAPIFSGTADWTPSIEKPGFYQVRVEMPGKTGVANHRQITLAVVRRRPSRAGGEFGWSLPGGEQSLSLTELAEVLGHSGCNWCKFPLWDESKPAGREEQLVSFAERLGLRRVELVGLLCRPPEALQEQLPGAESQQAAGIFSMPVEMWYPSLEPIMTRLSLKVRWWQLGQDRDQSFVGYPELGKKIAQLKQQFTRYGQRVHLGMGWSWLKELPDEKPTWDFLALSADPSLTWEEQIAYLRATKGKGCLRWVVLDPLPREHYSLATRTTDLAMRMIAAKMEAADGVFVSDAFNDSKGVMNEDGTVGELFVPWRTVAHLLAGAKPLGGLQLPSNTKTQIFQRGEEIVMAVWSDQPARVPLFLGDEARQIDLWGRESPVPVKDGLQVVEVGPTPLFISHMSTALMHTQMSAQFETATLASQFGQPQQNGLSFKNHFPQSIGGQVRIVTPQTWNASPRDITFKAAAGETVYQQFEIALQPTATTGRQFVRLDFDVTTDRRQQFSIYRQMEIGLSDIHAEALTRLNERGDLEVEQRIINETDEAVSLKCYLYVPGRKRMMMYVEDHGRGMDVKTYRVYNGTELIGQSLFLRAEEINGPRILNFSVVAQP